jgi:hypothetical protein
MSGFDIRSRGALSGHATRQGGVVLGVCINGLFQTERIKAPRYIGFEAVRAVLFLIAGKIDFAGFNVHAP